MLKQEVNFKIILVLYYLFSPFFDLLDKIWDIICSKNLKYKECQIQNQTPVHWIKGKEV